MAATAKVRRDGNSERERDDFYVTPHQCTRDLLAREWIGREVWEPACGDGAMAQVLEATGRRVISTDLIHRGYGAGGRDFLLERDLLAPHIVTNPPFRLADEFVAHALDLGAEKIALFLRLAFLEGRRRHERLYATRPPARVWVYSGRQTLWIGGHERQHEARGGAIPFAWFVWTRGFHGHPELRWIA